MGKENKLEQVVTYTDAEAKEASGKYFKGNDLAGNVWVNKYALKDSQGNIYEKSPKDMHERLSKEIARIEAKYDNPMGEKEIFDLIDGFKYIVPQGGPMTGIGNDYQVVSLSNCFVVGENSDSYGGILKTDQEQIQLMKRRGGVGHDLSHIRPKGSPVKNSALTSTGVVPFMERYSNSTREVAQDGRRGALMLSLSVKHPDAEDFIDAKVEQGKVTGANVSVKLDDEFMDAAINDKMYTQKYPIDSDNPKMEKEIRAKDLWDKIVHNAWKSGEPGLMFWDTIIRESVPDSYADQGYRTVSTNPCGEIPLCPYDSCRLLALNLNSYVENPYTEEAEFNFSKFKKHVHYAQRIMDDVIDLEAEKIDKILSKIESDPESAEVKRTERKLWEKINHKNLEGRRTGIGITAEGDMLASMGLKYGSDDAIDFSEEVHKTLAVEAYRSSVNLAKERGAFGVYDSEKEKDNPFINRLYEADPKLKEEMEKHGRRNIALLTIAPTGTTSIMTETTSGIEPMFMPFYKRRKKVNPNDKNVKVDFVDEVGDSWEEYVFVEPGFKRYLKAKGISEKKFEELNKSDKEKDQEKVNEIYEASPYFQATSNDVDWVQKVKMQGRIQKWVDHSISVTVNLPNDVEEKVVGDVYETAWKAGCKGVTVYRDGSRSGVLVSAKDKSGGLEDEVKFPAKRPKEVDAVITRFKNQNGHLENWIAFTGVIDGRPYENFTGKDDLEDFHVPNYINSGKIIKTKNKKGETRYDFQFENKYGDDVILPGISNAFNPEFHNYAKLFSGILQSNTPVNKVIKLANGLKFDDGNNINSWINGFTRSLKPFAEGEKVLGETCNDCESENLEYKEGCMTCADCGCSKCG